MEPQLPQVGPTPERSMPVSHDQAPSLNVPRPPDAAPIQSVEQGRNMEQSVGDAQGLAMPAVSVPVVVPVPTITPQPVVSQSTTDDANPATAADDDLIEKEWVNKAKQVVQSTRDDPYEQEKQIGQLMADYVRKRYGKEVGKAQE